MALRCKSLVLSINSIEIIPAFTLALHTNHSYQINNGSKQTDKKSTARMMKNAAKVAQKYISI